MKDLFKLFKKAKSQEKHSFGERKSEDNELSLDDIPFECVLAEAGLKPDARFEEIKGKENLLAISRSIDKILEKYPGKHPYIRNELCEEYYRRLLDDIYYDSDLHLKGSLNIENTVAAVEKLYTRHLDKGHLFNKEDYYADSKKILSRIDSLEEALTIVKPRRQYPLFDETLSKIMLRKDYYVRDCVKGVAIAGCIASLAFSHLTGDAGSSAMLFEGISTLATTGAAYKGITYLLSRNRNKTVGDFFSHFRSVAMRADAEVSEAFGLENYKGAM